MINFIFGFILIIFLQLGGCPTAEGLRADPSQVEIDAALELVEQGATALRNNQTECSFSPDGRLNVQGKNIRLSEVARCVTSRSGMVKWVTVIATSTVSLDVNIRAINQNYRRTFDLIVVAPTWVAPFSDPVTLDLTGFDGSPISDSLPFSGANGKPGLPGGNGGNFIGIANTLDGPVPEIITNGGSGGPGQYGRSGRTGSLGDSPDGNSFTWKRLSNCQRFEKIDIDITSSFRVEFVEHICPIECSIGVYRLLGRPGGRGEDGGDGGKGGPGGLAGIQVLSVGRNDNVLPEIVSRKRNGFDGQPGVGGEGGDGGYYGDNLKIIFDDNREYAHWLNPFAWIRGWQCIDEVHIHTEVVWDRGPRGNQGKHGANSIGRAKPKRDLSEQEIKQYIQEIRQVYGRLWNK